MQGNSGPGVPIDDSPVRFQQPDGTVFSPTNPDKRNHGWVTIRNALGNSYNVTAFRAAQALGVNEVVRVARHAGLTGLDGSYGPAIAIGGVDIRGLDLAYAYSVLANGGVMRGQKPAIAHAQGERGIDPVSILSVARNTGEVLYQAERLEHRQFPEQQVFLVNSILSDPNAQCQTFGCGGISIPGYQVAVKTGTSEPFDPQGPNARQDRRDLGLRIHAGRGRWHLGRQRRQRTDHEHHQQLDRLPGDARPRLEVLRWPARDAVHASPGRGEGPRLLHLTCTHVC